MEILNFNDYTSEVFHIKENVKAAKKYMLKNFSGDKGENIDPRIKEKFEEILELTKKSPGYTYPFTLFRFSDQGVSIEELENLLSWITQNKQVLSRLPKNIEEYSKIDKKENGDIGGFEQLNDDIATLELEKDARWFIKELPGDLRRQYRDADATEKKQLHTLVKVWMKEIPGIENDFENETRRGFFGRIKEIQKDFSTIFLPRFSSYIKGFNATKTIQDKVIKHYENNLGAISLELTDGVFPIFTFTEKAQKDLCSMGNWCINTGSFKGYTGTGRIQLNIYNFNEEVGSQYYLTGITIRDDEGNYSISSSADINNRSIGAGDLSKWFESTGNKIYSEEATKKITISLPWMFSTKEILEECHSASAIIDLFKEIRNGLDNNKTRIIGWLLDGVNKDELPESLKDSSEAIEKSVKMVIGKILEKDENLGHFSEYYKIKGVLTSSDIKFYKKFVVNKISSSDRKEIREKTLKLIDNVAEVSGFINKEGVAYDSVSDWIKELPKSAIDTILEINKNKEEIKKVL